MPIVRDDLLGLARLVEQLPLLLKELVLLKVLDGVNLIFIDTSTL